MAANKIFLFGPVQLNATLTTNLLNPPTATGGVNAGSSPNYLVLKYLRIVNRTGTAATASFWLGATGGNVAGTEVIGQQLSVAANSYVECYGPIRIDSTQFLVGGASVGSALTIQGYGEIGVAG